MEGQSKTEKKKTLAKILIIIVSTSLMTLDLHAVRRHNLLYLKVQENKYDLYLARGKPRKSLISPHLMWHVLEWICANISDSLSKWLKRLVQLCVALPSIIFVLFKPQVCFLQISDYFTNRESWKTLKNFGFGWWTKGMHCRHQSWFDFHILFAKSAVVCKKRKAKRRKNTILRWGTVHYYMYLL